jgi:transcriptional regulator with XRE-family HTH domain
MRADSPLPDRIAQARKRAGLSQSDLAVRLEINRGAVAKWESGERSPSVDELCRLADVLAAPVGWLLGKGGSGRPFTPKGGVNPPPTAHHPVPPPGWPCLSQPGGCLCKCHSIRAGKLKSPKTQVAHRKRWLPEHDAVVRDRLQAGVHVEQIARELTERFIIPRTAMGVENRARRHLGLSLFDGWTSSTQLARRLGVPKSRIEAWRERGYLSGVPDFKQWPRYLEPEIEAFVQQHAGVLFDVRLVRDSRLRSLAETSAIANRRRAVGA